MVIFYKWKKYNESQLTENKIDLNIRKMINHPPSPELGNMAEAMIIMTIRHNVEK